MAHLEPNTQSGDETQAVASRAEVQVFLQYTTFDRYQAIELPYGMQTPGMDRGHSAALVFTYPLDGKSVLDVGCKYGYFCHEALKRGARCVKGIDVNAENIRIAQRIIDLWQRPILVECLDIMALGESDMYDVVLFLNVMHHLLDPVDAMVRLASVTRELLIAELPTPLDTQLKLSKVKRYLLRRFFRDSPLVYIDERVHHRPWYFSRTAFENLFLKQMHLFRRLEFVDSPRKANRLLVYCWK
jgi:2-polyprenyl-3-methyl-5-hydroxy-6-metoxy-1,4-benzoquinol methylase